MMDRDYLEGLSRKQLQALCKTHGIPANLKSTHMVLRLSLRFQEPQKPLKKVKFSPENDQTFLFVDSDSDPDHATRSSRRLSGSRPHTTEAAPLTLGRATRSKKNDAAKSKESVATVEEDCGKPRKRNAARAPVVAEPVSGKRHRTTPSIQENHRLVAESKQENSMLPEPDSPTGVEVNALKTNKDSSDATDEVTNESIDVTESMATEEEVQQNENMIVDETEENGMETNINGHHLSASSSTPGGDSSEDPNTDECSISEELKAKSVIVQSLDAEIADGDGKPNTQEEACSVELALDVTGKSEPEKSSEEADDNGTGPAVFQESGKQIAEETISLAVSNETSPQNLVNEAELKREQDSVSEEGVPKSAHHFGLEGNESETPIAANKSGSLDCDVRNEAPQTGEVLERSISFITDDLALLEDRAVAEEFSETKNDDVDRLIENTSFSADDDPILFGDKANVGNEIGKMGYGLNTEDYSETNEGPVVPQGDVDVSPQSQEHKVGVTSEKMYLDDLIEEDSTGEGGGPGLVDHFTLEKFLKGNESETPSATNKTRSLDCDVRNEATQTDKVLERSISFIADDLALLVDRADAEEYSETKNDDVEGGIAAQQAEADPIIESEKIVLSSLRDEYGSPCFNGEINEGSKNAVSAVDEGASLQGNKSPPEKVNLNSCISSEDSLDPTTEPRKEHDVSTPMFLEELFGDHDDGKPVERDAVQEDGLLNMDVDCFIPSPDTGVVELGVHSAEVTTLEFDASLRNGEEADMEKLHDLFAEEDAEENVILNEDSDQAFERQLSEHEHNTEQAELFVITQEKPENSDMSEWKIITSTANVEIIDVAFGNKEMEEKRKTPIVIQENKDGAIEFHRPVETTEIDAASVDTHTMQVKPELVQESARQTCFDGSANSTKRRTNTNIPRHQQISTKYIMT